MNCKIIEPIINDKNQPCWLCKTEETIIPLNTKKPELKISYTIEKQGLWICKKCGATIECINNNPDYCSGCERNSSFEQKTKIINSNLWKLPKWIDIPLKNLDMKKVYNDILDLIKKLLVLSNEIEYKIITLWIISTWKEGYWDTVGYPVFIGIPNSGKTRALRIIAELGYRVLNTSGVTFKAIPRATHFYHVTILIDEAHDRLNKKNESGIEMYNFVKASYKKGSTYTVCDNDRQDQLITYHNFGFKAFSGEKTFKRALLSRSFIIWMDKEDPEISKLNYCKKQFEELRSQLINYRYKTNDPEDLGNDFILKGRTREIYESIIATGKHIRIDISDIIEYAKKENQREEDSLQDTVEFDILSAIKDHEEHPFTEDAPDRISYNTLIDKIGWDLEDKTNNRKLGYILKNMGIEPKKTAEGRVIYIQDQKNSFRLKRLYKRYKLV